MTVHQVNRFPIVAAVTAVVLVLAACVVRLRGDEEQSQRAASVTQDSDPIAKMLEKCRTVTYEHKEDLLDCRQIWAEKRRQFLGSKSGPSSVPPDAGTFDSKSSVSAPPKDESRLPTGYPTAPMPGRE
jgi:conjugative transfer region protein TrbK